MEWKQREKGRNSSKEKVMRLCLEGRRGQMTRCFLAWYHPRMALRFLHMSITAATKLLRETEASRNWETKVNFL